MGVVFSSSCHCHKSHPPACSNKIYTQHFGSTGEKPNSTLVQEVKHLPAVDAGIVSAPRDHNAVGNPSRRFLLAPAVHGWFILQGPLPIRNRVTKKFLDPYRRRAPPQALHRVELLPLLALSILCFLEVSLVWGRRRQRDLATGEQTPAQVEGSRER